MTFEHAAKRFKISNAYNVYFFTTETAESISKQALRRMALNKLKGPAIFTGGSKQHGLIINFGCCFGTLFFRRGFLCLEHERFLFGDWFCQR